jgi:SAM-dependent methyltransferase
LAAAVGLGWRPLGTDISLEACAVARKASGAGAVQAEAARLPFRDGCADAAAMVNVLDHLPDPAGALAEVHRVLGAGGLLAVRVLNGAFHRPVARALDLAGPLGRWSGLGRFAVLHVFSFTAAGLRSLVEAAGFDVLEVRNSLPVAARGDRRGPRPPGWLAAMVAGAAALAARGSGGRWLLAPSIELYACRAARPREGRA